MAIQSLNTVAADSGYSIALLRQVAANYGFSDRWAYRDVMRGEVILVFPAADSAAL